MICQLASKALTTFVQTVKRKYRSDLRIKSNAAPAVTEFFIRNELRDLLFLMQGNKFIRYMYISVPHLNQVVPTCADKFLALVGMPHNTYASVFVSLESFYDSRRAPAPEKYLTVGVATDN